MNSHPFVKSPNHEQFQFHWNSLAYMYKSAPFSKYFHNIAQIPDYGQSIVATEIQTEFFNAANTMHGGFIFKALDDAAWFAAQSINKDTFMFTSGFQLSYFKPVSEEMKRQGLSMIAKGKVISATRHLVVAEAELYCGESFIAKGTGSFMLSTMRMDSLPGYAAYGTLTPDERTKSDILISKL